MYRMYITLETTARRYGYIDVDDEVAKEFDTEFNADDYLAEHREDFVEIETDFNVYENDGGVIDAWIVEKK